MHCGIIVVLLVTIGVTFGGVSPNGGDVLRSTPSLDRAIAEDAAMDVDGLLTKYQYPHELYTVTTEDGYILLMHRITGSRGEHVTPEILADKPVVFMMHGILGSSADWITLGPEHGFGYLLADEGYDVWMGNARGNYYSRKHVTLNPENSDFWKFSWDEIGYYDLPAMIDKALQVSGKSKLHYIGYSQGTTSFFVMTSRRPVYNSKIKSTHALAPVAYMSNLVSPVLRLLAPFVDVIEVMTSLIGVHEFLPNNELMTTAGDLLCKEDAFFQPVCTNILFLLCGFNHELYNTTSTPIILGHTPAGASSKQLVHYAQGVNSGKFRRMDLGSISNLMKYGSLKPPHYDLKLITTPVFLHYSDNDWVSAVEDVKQLNKELGHSVGMFKVPHDKFNHLDYMWAINIRELLYYRIVKIMRYM